MDDRIVSTDELTASRGRIIGTDEMGAIKIPEPGPRTSELEKELQAARLAAAEVDRAGGDAPHEPCMGLAIWIRVRADLEKMRVADAERRGFEAGMQAGLTAAAKKCRDETNDCSGRSEFEILPLSGLTESWEDFRRRYDAEMKERDRRHDSPLPPEGSGCGACDFYAPRKCPRHSA